MILQRYEIQIIFHFNNVFIFLQVQISAYYFLLLPTSKSFTILNTELYIAKHLLKGGSQKKSTGLIDRKSVV